LRRFPWKIPDAKADSSFRLYVRSHPELCSAATEVPASPATTNGRKLAALSTADNDKTSNARSESEISTASSSEKSVNDQKAQKADQAADDIKRVESPSSMSTGDGRSRSRSSTTSDYGNGPLSPAGQPGVDVTTPTEDAGTNARALLDKRRPTHDAKEKDPMTAETNGSSTDVESNPGTQNEMIGGSDFGNAMRDSSVNTATNSTAKPPIGVAAAGVSGEQPQRRRPYSASVSSQQTYVAAAADSIFRLLPRETRSCLTRMLTIEPSMRCTFADLLRGGEGADADMAFADEWLPGVKMCITKGAIKGGDVEYHQHILIGANAPEEKPKKNKK